MKKHDHSDTPPHQKKSGTVKPKTGPAAQDDPIDPGTDPQPGPPDPDDPGGGPGDGSGGDGH